MSPSAEEIRNKRDLAGYTQTEAAELIYAKLRTWQDWESDAPMHPGLWELFLIRIEQPKRRRYQKRSPDPAKIKELRDKAGLSQSRAAELVYTARRTWQDWEAGVAKMHPGLWELFKHKLAKPIMLAT
jgi:DNA-binding transcriptional regulator YiaG